MTRVFPRFDEKMTILTIVNYAGVRQGRILSPLLFSLFVDVLLQELEKPKLGCYIKNICFNSFMYADDLILLSPIVNDMQKTMTLCGKLLADLDIPINVNKCCCIIVGPCGAVSCAPILLCNEPIPWVNEMKILGLQICNGKHFSCNRSQLKSKFYQCVNSILSRNPSSGDTSALLTLFMAKSVPKFLSGIEATGLSKAKLKSACHAYDGICKSI